MRAKVRGLSPDPIAATATWYVPCSRHATPRDLLAHVSPALLLGLEPLDRASCVFGQACAAMGHVCVCVCTGVVVYACAFICNRVYGCVCRHLNRCGCVRWFRLI